MSFMNYSLRDFFRDDYFKGNWFYRDGKLRVEVPGYGEEDLSVELEDNLLTIRGKDLELDFNLSNRIDREAIKCEVEKGVLTIDLVNRGKKEKIKLL